MKLTTIPRRGTRETSQGRWSWPRIIGATGAAVAVGASTIALTTPAEALDTAHIGAVSDATGGFPTFYTDDAGTSLQPCIDGTARCGGATLTDDGAGGPGLGVAPDGEGFYWSATATLNSPRGSVDVELAHEAAWASATRRIVFDRTRIRGDLTPGKYTLLTPYGTVRFSAVGTDQRNVNVTKDPACTQVASGPCRGQITNWLRSVNAPVGYLGNSVAVTQFTGGTERNEFVLRAANGSVIGRQSRAAIMGKLATGPAAMLSTGAVDFGNTAKVARRTVTLKNQGTADLNLQSVNVAGSNTISVAPGGCAAGATVASGASCKVNLTYRPGKLKSSKATLVINDDTTVGVHRVPVTASTSSEFSARRAVDFNAVKVGRSSKTHRVVVTNTGVTPLKIQGMAITGSGARSFERRSGQAPVCAKGSVVRPRASCALYVGFAPKTFGAKTANLKVRTNAASSPDQVQLSGRGR